ncbi:hypothetical protein [Priestia megaterium]|uniref:hypothetical protein n=1 Tax=Priestia megaterium TaxID=1404 RepID=UPI0015D4BCC8|nr:hypothetical protein [Priestia megaterium]
MNKLNLPPEVKEAVELFKRNNSVFKNADDSTVIMYALDYATATLLKETKVQRNIH